MFASQANPAVALAIASTWDGLAVGPDEAADLSIAADGDGLLIEVRAPFHGDPAPAGPPGPTPALWEHEVVELFVLGPDDRYTEIELGPHGHHLVLRLAGRRNPVAQGLPLAYTAAVDGDRWRGQARVQRALLPPGPHRVTAYANHGVGPARRSLAWTPVPGLAPDFHRLDCFPVVALP